MTPPTAADACVLAPRSPLRRDSARALLNSRPLAVSERIDAGDIGVASDGDIVEPTADRAVELPRVKRQAVHRSVGTQGTDNDAVSNTFGVWVRGGCISDLPDEPRHLPRHVH